MQLRVHLQTLDSCAQLGSVAFSLSGCVVGSSTCLSVCVNVRVCVVDSLTKASKVMWLFEKFQLEEAAAGARKSP